MATKSKNQTRSSSVAFETTIARHCFCQGKSVCSRRKEDRGPQSKITNSPPHFAILFTFPRRPVPSVPPSPFLSAARPSHKCVFAKRDLQNLLSHTRVGRAVCISHIALWEFLQLRVLFSGCDPGMGAEIFNCNAWQNIFENVKTFWLLVTISLWYSMITLYKKARLTYSDKSL